MADLGETLTLFCEVDFAALLLGVQLLEGFVIVADLLLEILSSLFEDGLLKLGEAFLAFGVIVVPVELGLKPLELGGEAVDFEFQPMGFGHVDGGTEGDEDVAGLDDLAHADVDFLDDGELQRFHDDGLLVADDLAVAGDDHVHLSENGPQQGGDEKEKGEDDAVPGPEGKPGVGDLPRIGLKLDGFGRNFLFAAGEEFSQIGRAHV